MTPARSFMPAAAPPGGPCSAVAGQHPATPPQGSDRGPGPRQSTRPHESGNGTDRPRRQDRASIQTPNYRRKEIGGLPGQHTLEIGMQPATAVRLTAWPRAPRQQQLHQAAGHQGRRSVGGELPHPKSKRGPSPLSTARPHDCGGGPDRPGPRAMSPTSHQGPPGVHATQH